MQTKKSAKRPAQNALGERYALERRKRPLIHFRNKQRAAPAPENVHRVRHKTQHRRKLCFVWSPPTLQLLIRADNFGALPRITEPVASRAQNVCLLRFVDSHVPRRHQIHGQRIFARVHPSRRLRPRTAHHSHKSIGSLVIRIQQNKIRRKPVQQHHQRRLAVRLPLHKKKFIATSSHPLQIANREIRHLNRMAAHFPKRNPEVRLFPASRNRVLCHPAEIRMWYLVAGGIDNRQPAFLHSKISPHFRDASVLEKLIVDIRGFDDYCILAAKLAQEVCKLPQQFRIGNDGAVLPRISQHEGWLDDDPQFLRLLSQRCRTLLQLFRQPTLVQQTSENAAFFLCGFSFRRKHLPAASYFAVHNCLLPQSPRQKIFANVLNLLSQRLFRLPRIDVENTKLSERSVVQVFSNIFRDLPSQRPDPRHKRGSSARKWRFRPRHMLPHRSSPSTHQAAHLLRKRLHPQQRTAVFEQRPT